MNTRIILTIAAAVCAAVPLLSVAQMEQFSRDDYERAQKEMKTVNQEVSNQALKAYLNGLKPTKENKTAFITALRVAKDAKGKEFKNLLYYTVPAMSEMQRLPDTYPLEGKLLAPVRIMTAGEEYEPGSVVFFPLEDLGKVTMTANDLKTKDGKTFPKANLDIKVIRVWYQNKNGWYAYFGDNGNKLCPELLLNDEDLVRVDTATESNYGRVTGKDGKVSYKWINFSAKVPSRPSDYYYGADMFQAMVPGFSDAKTLQPVSLDKGMMKQIFITAYTPKTQPAGLYKGTIAVRGAKCSLDIPVEIRVLPFELPKPCAYDNPEKEMLVTFYNYTYFHKIKELNGGDQKLAEEQLYQTLVDQVKHGHTFNWISPRMSRGNCAGDYEFEKIMELSKKAGCRMDIVPAYPRGGPGSGQFSLEQSVQITKNYLDKMFGHHNALIGHGDEPPAQWCLDARHHMEAFRKEGMGFILAGKQQVFYTLNPYVTCYNMAAFPEYDVAPSLWNQTKGEYVAWYAAQHVGAENPAYNRRQYGLTPYLAGYTAFCNYAHHYGSWNDRVEGAYKPMVFAYGSGNGVIDTIQWEGFREGLDDIRYATYLKRLAVKAIDSKDIMKSKYGSAALTFFAEFDKLGTDLNYARFQMVEHIMKLREVLGEK